MKTIALKEKTFNLIKELKEKEKISSFDKLIIELVMKKEGVKDSMFGALKGKTKSFTRKEREEMWKDSNRLK
ncbi:hypothetical protein KAI04_01275 [Candidatus Pacearchaeota archaeon]|nr:hypothetical protein [Candidatus Pacearchaeota archaeon]